MERRARLALLASLAAAASLAAVVTTSASWAETPPRGVITVRVQGLRSSDGQVGCTIYASPHGFPTDPSTALQRLWCPVAHGSSTCAFDPVPPGTYAIACFHDENKNGKLDRGPFGIPREGTVASNQAKGFLGPPSFEKAKFSYAGGASELKLNMEY